MDRHTFTLELINRGFKPQHVEELLFRLTKPTKYRHDRHYGWDFLNFEMLHETQDGILWFYTVWRNPLAWPHLKMIERVQCTIIRRQDEL